MKLINFIIILLFFSSTISFAQNNEINTLLEKVNRTTSVKEKKKLLEELKIKLAQRNKKAREEADAIIKAKQKMPQQFYKDTIRINKSSNE